MRRSTAGGEEVILTTLPRSMPVGLLASAASAANYIVVRVDFLRHTVPSPGSRGGNGSDNPSPLKVALLFQAAYFETQGVEVTTGFESTTVPKPGGLLPDFQLDGLSDGGQGGRDIRQRLREFVKRKNPWDAKMIYPSVGLDRLPPRVQQDGDHSRGGSVNGLPTAGGNLVDNLVVKGRPYPHNSDKIPRKALKVVEPTL